MRSVDASSATMTSNGSPSARAAWSIALSVRPRNRSSLYAGMMKEIDAISLTPNVVPPRQQPLPGPLLGKEGVPWPNTLAPRRFGSRGERLYGVCHHIMRDTVGAKVFAVLVRGLSHLKDEASQGTSRTSRTAVSSPSWSSPWQRGCGGHEAPCETHPYDHSNLARSACPPLRFPPKVGAEASRIPKITNTDSPTRQAETYFARIPVCMFRERRRCKALSRSGRRRISHEDTPPARPLQ